MSSELNILALYGLLVMAITVVQVLTAAGQVGLPMLSKPRDDMPRLTGVAGRMERCLNNSVVALALFAPAVLILAEREAFTGGTLLAAQIFLLARLGYTLLYPAGIVYARTAIWGLDFLATAWLYIAAF